MTRLTLAKALAYGALLGAWAVDSQAVGAECLQGSCPSGSGDDVALLQRAKQADAAVKKHSGEKQQDAHVLPWGPVSTSKVCVWNQGGYALEYKIQDAESLSVIAQTSSYPNPQKQCTDLRTQAGVHPGEEYIVWVHAIAGKTVTTDRGIQYDRFSPEVTFKCTGSTTLIQCNLYGTAGMAAQAAAPPAVMTAPVLGAPLAASQVCVWNQGGYALYYKVADARTNQVVVQTSSYPNPQTRCTDIRNAAGVHMGEQLQVWVTAVAGSTVTTNPGIRFHPLAATITFKCTGSTTMIQCNFYSVE